MIVSGDRRLLVDYSSADLGSERVERAFEAEENSVAFLLSPRWERVEIPGTDEREVTN